MKKRLVDADKLMERAKMHSVLVTVEHEHHDYGMTLGTLNKIVKECEITGTPADLVSKKAALDAAIEAVDEWDGGYNVDRANKIIRAIMRLPSEAPDGQDNLVKDSQCLVKDLANDCISRQALCEYALNQKDKNITANDIMRFPPAQPESAKRTAEEEQNVSDSDLISRKAAIDAIRASTSKYTGFMEMEMYTDDDAVEAIEALPPAQPAPEEFEWCRDCKEYDQDAHCCHRWTKAIQKTVKELEATWPKQQWILCSERLPETGHEYLYCTDMGTVHMGFYWGGLGFGYGFDYGYDIVAWMPLPQPYKGEKHG